MNGPLVSILTPSYNQARWLGDNLGSVACQTYREIEHIVMDGGSSDGSTEMLRAAAAKDRRLRWWSQPDRGQSHALNKAFDESHGLIIGWLNSDDAYFDPGVVEAVAGVFERHAEIDVVYGHSAYVNAQGSILHLAWAPRFDYRLLRLYDFIIQPAVFIRRSAITTPFVDEQFDFAMDWELWLRLGLRRRFFRLDRILAIDRLQYERKSLTALQVLQKDTVRLALEYGVAQSRPWRALSFAHAVYCRFRGAALVLALPSSFAFPAQKDSRSALLLRQLATRRIHMSVDDGTDVQR